MLSGSALPGGKAIKRQPAELAGVIDASCRKEAASASAGGSKRAGGFLGRVARKREREPHNKRANPATSGRWLRNHDNDNDNDGDCDKMKKKKKKRTS